MTDQAGQQLPPGWITAPLGDFIERIEAGASFKCEERPPCDGEVGVAKVSAVTWGEYDEDESKTCHDTARIDENLLIASGDFLFSRANTISLVGACVIARRVTKRVMLSDKILRLRFRALQCEWVLHFLRSSWGRSHIERLATGNQESMRNIGQDRIRSIPVPVAPTHEQRRIVAAIEQHLSDIDAGVAALERALANLKRYRAAVLKAACEGHLVPTEAHLARKEGRTYERADVLLGRILIERRAQWEAEQLAKMNAKGQVPRDDQWKEGYEEPKGLNATGVFDLPDGWTWVTVDQTVTIIDYRGRTPPFSPAGVPHLRSANVRDGKIVWKDLAYISEETYRQYMTRGLPKAGDLLFTTEAPLGEVALAPVETKFSVAQRMMILRGDPGIWVPAFLRLQIMGQRVQSRLRLSATGSTVTGVSSRNFRPLALLVPPIFEQQRIAAEVDRLLSVADETEQLIRAQLARAERLRQSVLKRAFEGKLVPQDPNDEPASALLARIRAESAAPEAKPARGRKPRRRPAEPETEA